MTDLVLADIKLAPPRRVRGGISALLFADFTKPPRMKKK